MEQFRILKTCSFLLKVLLMKPVDSLERLELGELFETPPGTISDRFQKARRRLEASVRRLAESPADGEETWQSLRSCMEEIRTQFRGAADNHG